MKNKLSGKITLALLMVVLCANTAINLVGCKSPADRVALNAAGIQIISVDAGMKAFSAQANAGKVTQSQLDAVNKYYPIYYQAAKLEQTAFETYATVKNTDNLNALQAAVSAAIASEADIIKLLNAALPKTLVVTPKSRTP